jgi:hypothetical protein
MWVVSLVIGILFSIVGLGGMLTGSDTGLIMVVGAGLWFKVAAIEKALHS